MNHGAPTAATAGALRWVRAVVVAATATGLALLGHVTGGGATPPPVTLLVLVGLVLLASLGLSGRRWTVGPLLGLLCGSQVVFHVAFGGPTTVTHVHHGPALTGTSAMTGHQGLAMLAAHAAAALLTAVLLRRGEDCLWRVVELLATAWRVTEVAARGAAVPRRCAEPASVLGSATVQLLEHAVARRGPPASAAA
jgi:hypothetical protein